MGFYVKFKGKVISPNHFKSSRTQKEAAFYQFHIFGYGRVIKKDHGYIITNTYNQEMPLRIQLGDHLSKKALFNDKIHSKVIFILISLIILTWFHHIF